MKRALFPSRLVLVLLLGGGVAACQRERLHPLVFEGTRPVVFAVLDPSEPITVRLTRTVPLDTPDSVNTVVANATVAMYENGTLLETLRFGSGGTYQSPGRIRPTPGRDYHVRAEHPQVGAARSAPALVPTPPLNPRVALGREELRSPGLRPAREVSFDLTDDPAVAGQYYALRLTARSGSGEKLHILTWPLDAADDTDNPCRHFETGHWLLPDACFNAGRTRVRLGAEIMGGTVSKPVPVRRLEVEVLAVSPDYYRYLAQRTRPSSAEQIFFDPMPIFTNVSGGYGVVGAVNRARFVLNL